MFSCLLFCLLRWLESDIYENNCWLVNTLKQMTSRFLPLISESFQFTHLSCTHFSAVYKQMWDPILSVTYHFEKYVSGIFLQIYINVRSCQQIHPPDFHCFPECKFCHKRLSVTGLIFLPSILNGTLW